MLCSYTWNLCDPRQCQCHVFEEEKRKSWNSVLEGMEREQSAGLFGSVCWWDVLSCPSFAHHWSQRFRTDLCNHSKQRCVWKILCSPSFPKVNCRCGSPCVRAQWRGWCFCTICFIYRYTRRASGGNKWHVCRSAGSYGFPGVCIPGYQLL